MKGQPEELKGSGYKERNRQTPTERKRGGVKRGEKPIATKLGYRTTILG